MHIPAAVLTDAQLVAAYVIFLASYLVFAVGKFPGLKIDRPGAAIIGAVAMIAFRIVRPADATKVSGTISRWDCRSRLQR